MITALTLLTAWLAADLVGGVVHWWEDRYLDNSQTLEFLHQFATDNQLHHDKPTAMTRNTHWENMASAAIVAWPLAFVLFLFGFDTFVWLTVFFSSFGNLIHRFAHEPKRKLPRWIRGMQRVGLFISHEHHETHHRNMGRLIGKAEANRAYCPATNWVNPVVDRLGLWLFLENRLATFGITTVETES